MTETTQSGPFSICQKMAIESSGILLSHPQCINRQGNRRSRIFVHKPLNAIQTPLRPHNSQPPRTHHHLPSPPAPSPQTPPKPSTTPASPPHSSPRPASTPTHPPYQPTPATPFTRKKLTSFPNSRMRCSFSISTTCCSSANASANGIPSSSALVLTTHSVLPPYSSPLLT